MLGQNREISETGRIPGLLLFGPQTRALRIQEHGGCLHLGGTLPGRRQPRGIARLGVAKSAAQLQILFSAGFITGLCLHFGQQQQGIKIRSLRFKHTPGLRPHLPGDQELGHLHAHLGCHIRRHGALKEPLHVGLFLQQHIHFREFLAHIPALRVMLESAFEHECGLGEEIA